MDQDLTIVQNSLSANSGQLVVSQGQSTAFTLKIKPRAIGELSIAISAVSDDGENDAVKKLLLVKVNEFMLPATPYPSKVHTCTR